MMRPPILRRALIFCVMFSRPELRALTTDFASGVLAFAALFLDAVVLGLAAGGDFVVMFWQSWQLLWRQAMTWWAVFWQTW